MFSYWWLIFFPVMFLLFLPILKKGFEKQKESNKEGRCGHCGVSLTAESGKIQIRSGSFEVSVCSDCSRKSKRQSLIRGIGAVVCILIVIFITCLFLKIGHSQ
jgi:hypothetical protein